MHHPELLVIPALQIAAYLLTIVGAKLAAKVYRKHFIVESFELNPIWRKSVEEQRWLNLRYLVAVAGVVAFLFLVDYLIVSRGLSDRFFHFILGAFIGPFLLSIGRQFGNVLLFLYAIASPYEISGKVHMTIRLSLMMSMFLHVGFAPLIITVAIVSRSNFAAGVAVSVVLLIAVHPFWALRSPCRLDQPTNLTD